LRVAASALATGGSRVRSAIPLIFPAGAASRGVGAVAMPVPDGMHEEDAPTGTLAGL
jgi:hypothetical protein